MVSYKQQMSVSLPGPKVLILVVIEDGLVHPINDTYRVQEIGLNPCCSGQWSRTDSSLHKVNSWHCVLILVVVEDSLVQT